jgi:hypothetical protein
MGGPPLGTLILACVAVLGLGPGPGGPAAHPNTAGRRLAPLAPSVLTASAQHQQFVWDFTPCFDRSVETSGTEFFDIGSLDLPGGCHLRFLTPGESWMQATFALADDPHTPTVQAGRWTLAIYHLAIQPEGPAPGLAPVRVTLNDAVVWQDPLAAGTAGPGNLWSLAVLDVTPQLQRGRNTVRFDFVGGGATHYWLKILRVGWDPL